MRCRFTTSAGADDSQAASLLKHTSTAYTTLMDDLLRESMACFTTLKEVKAVVSTAKTRAADRGNSSGWCPGSRAISSILSKVQFLGKGTTNLPDGAWGGRRSAHRQQSVGTVAIPFDEVVGIGTLTEASGTLHSFNATIGYDEGTYTLELDLGGCIVTYTYTLNVDPLPTAQMTVNGTAVVSRSLRNVFCTVKQN